LTAAVASQTFVPKVTYRRVRTADEAALVTTLVWEFFDYLRVNFPDRAQMIDTYLEAQDVAGELADLLTLFTPLKGECLLAYLGEAPVGVLMLKRRTDAICEMNRMWVRPEGRGHGIGRGLIEELMAAAKEMGFTEMKLEALDERIPAVPLYAKMGFETDPDRSSYAQEDLRVIAMKRAL